MQTHASDGVKIAEVTSASMLICRLLHDLLEWEDLEKTHQEYEVKNAKSQRDKTMLGLLICQAVTIEELEKLEPGHIQLRKGKIEVPSGSRSNRRIMALEASQILGLTGIPGKDQGEASERKGISGGTCR